MHEFPSFSLCQHPSQLAGESPSSLAPLCKSGFQMDFVLGKAWFRVPPVVPSPDGHTCEVVRGRAESLAGRMIMASVLPSPPPPALQTPPAPIQRAPRSQEALLSPQSSSPCLASARPQIDSRHPKTSYLPSSVLPPHTPRSG